jgi:predicted small metal-binding protein
MPKTMLECPCGKEITAKDEDELVRKTQEHLAAQHPGHEYTREQILLIAR